MDIYDLNIREKQEKYERDNLSQNACLVVKSKGRKEPEEKCPLRTDFQRDRDRILHSKSFRRLKHKTQVYISPNGDHYRTRLTHTLEVSQIARTMARALGLNEDLVETISLGHDLGHTPFGHIGEEALDEISDVGFKHNIQSLRIVDKLEEKNNRKGLNLTYEVRNGIASHTGDNKPDTMEAELVRIADRIAYVNHDIDDSIRANIITEEDLPKSTRLILGKSHGDRINTMVFDLIENSYGKDKIIMSEEISKASKELRDFMFQEVYQDSQVKAEADKAFYIINELYNFYIKNPHELGENYRNFEDELDLQRSVCDYIAGMTDRFVMYKFHEIFLPKSWHIL